MHKNVEKNKHKTSYQISCFFFYVSLFFLLAIGGWIWEVLLYTVQDKTFVNRGVLFGPWLPVYGCGGIALYLLLNKWVKKPIRVFILSACICSILEYFAGWYLEWAWGIKWWDYTGHFLNIKGRICLLCSLLFGLGGWLLICHVEPYLKRFYEKIYKNKKQRKTLQIICLILIVLFIADATWSADFPNKGENISYEN